MIKTNKKKSKKQRKEKQNLISS